MNADLQPIRVLMVDDDPVNLEILRDYLEDEDFETLSITSALDALSFLKNYDNKINLILLDRMMPVMDGITFVNTIAGDAKLAKIPVIMITAAAMSHQIDEVLHLPIRGLVTKPFEREKLIEAIFIALQTE